MHLALAFFSNDPGSVVVHRPEPGIARGVFEAPAWALLLVAALVVLGAGAVLWRRLRKRASARR